MLRLARSGAHATRAAVCANRQGCPGARVRAGAGCRAAPRRAVCPARSVLDCSVGWLSAAGSDSGHSDWVRDAAVLTLTQCRVSAARSRSPAAAGLRRLYCLDLSVDTARRRRALAAVYRSHKPSVTVTGRRSRSRIVHRSQSHWPSLPQVTCRGCRPSVTATNLPSFLDGCTPQTQPSATVTVTATLVTATGLSSQPQVCRHLLFVTATACQCFVPLNTRRPRRCHCNGYLCIW